MSIYVDLDGTLAYYDKWEGIEHIGDPIPLMLERVMKWLKEGKEVVIFTSRLAAAKDLGERGTVKYFIEKWCRQHIGQVLKVTDTKGHTAEEFWDDRAVAVEKNTGVIKGRSRE